MCRPMLWLALQVLLVCACLNITPALAHAELETRIADLSAQLQDQPGQGALHLQRAELYRLHQNWRAAQADYRRARQLSPDLAQLNFLEGRFERQRGMHQRAATLLDRQLAETPDMSLAWFELAHARRAMDQPVAALASWERGLESSTRRSPDLYLLYLALQQEAGVPLTQQLEGLAAAVADLGPLVALIYPAVELSLAADEPAIANRWLDRVPDSARRGEQWRRFLAAVELASAGAGKS